MRRLVCSAILAAIAIVPTAARERESPIFVFRQNVWTNLHHFLYVLGRAENRASDARRAAVADAPTRAAAGVATLSEQEKTAWTAAVTTYARGWSKKDVVFDPDAYALTARLVAATEGTPLSQSGISTADAAPLESVVAIYKRTWWPDDTKANTARIKELQTLIDMHGAAVLAYFTRAFQEHWPTAGYPVNVSAFTNWAGAYSTDNRVLVISSLDAATGGLAGFETIFHEAAHQWDPQMEARIATAARTAGLASSPEGLSHAIIFYTAGEAVKSVAPTYVSYADATGIWLRGGNPRFKPALDAAWKPYLDGRGTLDAALVSVIRLIKAAPSS